MPFKKGRKPWNTGLTKETDKRIYQSSKKAKERFKDKTKHPMFGKHPKGYWKGKKRPDIKKLMKGEKNPLNRKEVRKKISISVKKYRKLHPEKHPMKRPEIRAKFKGRLNNRYGKSPKLPKWHKYNGKKFRSSWEVIFAKWLDKKGLTWQYEPKRFFFER